MDNVIGITIANLNYIFMFVFAYVGLNYALYFTSRMRKKSVGSFYPYCNTADLGNGRISTVIVCRRFCDYNA